MNNKTMTSAEAILRDRKKRGARNALLLCLAILVVAGVVGVFHLPATAKTYQKWVLTCPAEAPAGPGYAGFFLHTHNDDCFDENGNLVCPLPEIKAHVHDENCFVVSRELDCAIPESDGHQHTAECYTRVRGDLTCALSTEPVLDEGGNVLEEGHVHTDECYAWHEELTCGKEAGEGAHHHDENCYRTVTTLTCDKPEIIPHVHTDACLQKNEDGSVYVDESGNILLICGLQELTEHVHGPECFTVYEMDDGVPEETGETYTVTTESETGSETVTETETETVTEIESETETVTEETPTTEGSEETGDGFIFLYPEEDENVTETETEIETEIGTEEEIPAPDVPETPAAENTEETEDGFVFLYSEEDEDGTETETVTETETETETVTETETETETETLIGTEDTDPENAGEAETVVTEATDEENTEEETQEAGSTEDDAENGTESDSVIGAEGIEPSDNTAETETAEAEIYSEGEETAEDKEKEEPADKQATEGEQETEETGESEETPEAVPTRRLGGEKGGATVLAEVPENLLGETARLSLEDYSTDDARAAILSAVNENAAEGEEREIISLYVIDIGLDVNGEPVISEGETPIRITIRAKEIRGMTAPKVYQLTNGTAVRIKEADFDPEAGTVSFTAYGFSAFAIADLTGEDPVDEAPEETPVSVSMPAQTFSGETENVVVSVTAPEGAFPEGTTMEVKMVELDDETMSSVEKAVEGKVTTVQAVDITFYDAEGNKIEPQTAIQVSMKSAMVSESENVSLIHKPDAAETDDPEAETPALEVVEAAIVEQEDAAAPSDEIIFESNAFSVYMLVGTETITTRYLTADGETYLITLTYGPEAMIPEGAGLAVSEIPQDSEEYAAYLAQAQSAVNANTPVETDPAETEAADAESEAESAAEADGTSEAESPESSAGGAAGRVTVTTARFFDITILDAEGNPVEPAAPVDVKIEYMEPAETAENYQVVHFGEETEVLNPAVSGADGAASAFDFQTSSFSVFGVVGTKVITIDFLTASGETYRIEVTMDERERMEGKAELSVEEILAGTESYEDYLYAASEYLFLSSVEDISFARFFDIKILKNGEKYEPQYPVQVKITYQDAIDLVEDQNLSVVHFASAGTEVIQAVELSEDGTELTYEQNGFSVTATVVSANNLQDGHQYVIYTSSNNQYYAMTHYSEGRDEDLVYGVQIDASATTGNSFTEEGYGSSIVWTAHKVTVGGSTCWTFSYEEEGKTYYLRTYGGLMVGADSDIDESSYRVSDRYQWRIESMRYNNRTINNTLRSYHNRNNNTYYLRYSGTNNGFKERDDYQPSSFYFADVSNYTQDVVKTPTIHYVDESGNELTVDNGRNWTTNTTTTPAFLMYDIDGYDYVKSTLGSVNGTEIRPIIRRFAGEWQYTSSEEESRTITWNPISQNQDIYVVYKKSAEPVTGGTPKVKESSATENPVDPAIHKTSVSNGDGTNTIGLSITADTSPLEVEKLADVIVIFDTSSSMTRAMGNNSTRLQVAKGAVNSLAETLIGDNTEFKDSAGKKLIRMSLISFNRNAELKQGFTENITDYKNAVNALTTEAGTNWEAALEVANHLAVDPERATFVIFVTDGNPSYRTSRGNTLSLEGYPETVDDDHLDVNTANSYYFYRVLEYFGALDENDQRNYNTAVVEAQSIVEHSKNLYCIGIGNSAGITRLQGLTSAAYHNETIGAERTKTADNEEELAQAFNDITASIVALLGWGDITMTDGITSLANTVEKSHLVNVDGNFEYWKAPAPEGWNDWSKDIRAAYIQGTSGVEITYPDGYNEWSQKDKDLYVYAFNLGKNLSDGSFSSWKPATENCNEARYDELSASVKWDMGHSFVPESGCTYRVTFRVWPSQEAYDILANLKNGTVTYNQLTAAQRAQIIDLGNGNYSLKTNDKEPNTTYKAARKTGDGVTTDGNTKELKFNDVDPMPLEPDKLTVKKEWDYDIGDTHKATALEFRLMVGDKYYQTDGTFETTTESAKVLPVSADSDWTNSVNIAPGIVIFDKNGNAELLETGHDYRLEECNITNDDTPFEASYEFTTQTVRPMILTVEGNETYHATLAYLVKIDDDNPALPEKDQFTIGDATYYVSSTGSEGTVVGTNHRKAELDITKLVTDSSETLTEADLNTETFTYRVTITVPKDTDCSQMTAYEFVYRADDDPRLNGNEPFEINGYQPGDGHIEGDEGKAGKHYRYYTVKKGNASIGDSFTQNGDGLTKSMTMDITLTRKEVLRFTNLPTGATYTIEEVYANYRQADPSLDVDAVGSDKARNLAEQGYSTSYKTKKSTDSSAAAGTGNIISGEITDLDIRYYNQFTNTLNQAADAELKVTKALDGLEWTADSKYYFKLTAVDGAPLPSGTESNTGRTQFYISNTTSDYTYTFGKIRFTRAGTYQYKITETDSSWNSVAGQVIGGIQYGPEETVTITVEGENGKLVIKNVTGSGNNTVSSNPDGSTVVVGTTTITNSSLTLPVKKIDKSTGTQLSGAEFEMLDGSEKLYFDSSSLILTADQVKTIIGMEITEKDAAAAMAEKGIKSSFSIGEITLKGLALDKTYTLREVHAPEGYIIADNNATFKLTREDNETKITTSGSNISVDKDGLTLLISNEHGVELPQTGGEGTLHLRYLGMTVMLGAALLLMARQRQKKES